MFDFALKHTTDEIDRRLRNPFWGGLFIGWITWNWRVWYLTFFVSESLVGNKIAEIQRMYEYFGWHALPGVILNWVIIPATISYLVIFHFPKITDLFLVRQKKNKDEEDKILRENFKSEEQNIKAETELIKAERDKFEAEKDKIKVQLEVEMKEKAFAWAQEEIKKAKAEGGKSEQETWDEEYRSLIDIYKTSMEELSSLIYEKEGYNYRYDNPGFTQIFEVHNLIGRIKGKNDSLVFELTSKGKYFLKKHSLEV